MTNNTLGNTADGLDCVVCGDRATGKGGHDPSDNFLLIEENILLFPSQGNITVRYHVMVVRDFFGEVFGKIRFTNVDIKIIVPLIKTNEINVDIVDGSMF